MAFSQLQNAMAALRLRLAEMQSKLGQLDAMIAQFRTQLRRLPRQIIYGPTGLDASLSALGEIEERLADAPDTRRRLATIPTIDECLALHGGAGSPAPLSPFFSVVVGSLTGGDAGSTFSSPGST